MPAAESVLQGICVSEVATQALIHPDFAPLPLGALICDRRYQITATVSNGLQVHAYLVQDRTHRLCRQCGWAQDEIGETYCSNCGLSFSQDSQRPVYLVRETREKEILSREAIIAELKLHHKGIVNIFEAVTYAPYGAPRFYLLSEPESGETLSHLPIPQPEEKVLAWGMQVAEALAYLHEHGVLHRQIRPESILISGPDARLTNFALAEKVPKTAPKEWYAEEALVLAKLLHDLLGNQPLSAPAASVFGKALAATAPDRYATAQALADGLTEALNSSQEPDNIVLVVGRCSDVGQQRQLNEDSLVTAEIQAVHQSQCRPIGLYAVADGMGGHSAGEVASTLATNALACAVIDRILLPHLNDQTPAEPDYGEMLKQACLQANRAVYDQARRMGSDMGTTLVAALLVGNEAYVANVGDSRAYLLEKQGIRQITRDHSLVEQLVAAKQITREEARTHPQRNIIFRTVGDKPQLEIDIFHQTLKRGDSLVLCSDGLHGMIEAADIEQTLLSVAAPQEACDQLIARANAAGGDDNITVIVVRVEGHTEGEQGQESQLHAMPSL
jgi:protein phosphatase